MIYQFRTMDHPAANGRKPQNGEREYRLTMTTDDGGTLVIFIGSKGRDALRKMLGQMDDAEQREKALTWEDLDPSERPRF